jgi:hypothetical protein
MGNGTNTDTSTFTAASGRRRTGWLRDLTSSRTDPNAALPIESLVWLTDIAGLTRQQAVEQMVWSAVALVRRTAQEA